MRLDARDQHQIVQSIGCLAAWHCVVGHWMTRSPSSSMATCGRSSMKLKNVSGSMSAMCSALILRTQQIDRGGRGVGRVEEPFECHNHERAVEFCSGDPAKFAHQPSFAHQQAGASLGRQPSWN